MKRTVNRRMFLQGAGGAAMAIPFLPSLFSRAFASDPVPGAIPKRFLAMSTMLGEVWGQNMYPDESILTQTMDYAGRQVRYGSLPTTANESGTVVFSPVCSASSQLMTPTLASKFNILRGIDVPYNMGHHEGVHLGNFSGHFAQATGGISDQAYLNPTIDQVMAFSPSFYSPEDRSAKNRARHRGTMRVMASGRSRKSGTERESCSTLSHATIQKLASGRYGRLCWERGALA